MGRIFGAIGVMAVLMVLSAAGGVYWFSATDANNAKRQAAEAIVNNLAIGLSQQIETIQKSVDGLAQSPEVIQALSSGDSEHIRQTANKFQRVIPYGQNLRLLMPDVNDLDESQTPRMGFGDLEMVRATLTGKPMPVVQGEAADRHLAVTSVVSNGQQVLGVVLASLDADLPKRIILKNRFADGLIELKQDRLVLASTGDAGSNEDDPVSTPVANTRWIIDSWVNVDASFGDIGMLVALIAVPALLTCLVLFVGYRKLHDHFRQDQSSILKAAKDMIQGKHVGNYPMQLEEMQPIITSMAQFKRVISWDDLPQGKDGEAEKDDFFDESLDLDFFEDAAPVTAEPELIVPVTDAQSNLDAEENNDLETIVIQKVQTRPTPSVSEIKQNKGKAKPTKAAVAEAKPTAALNIFRQYDIGGMVGKGLDEEVIGNIGRAFASEAKQANVKTIVVARDGRLSSPKLTAALIKGIVSTGCDVLDLGLVPTPVLCFVAHHTEGRTGVMVTGSELAADYNGLKMVLHDEAVSKEQIQALKARVYNGEYIQDQAGSVEQNTLFSNEYIGIISEEVHIVRPMTVVVDCGNGACGQLVPTLLKTVGCHVVELNCEIDGRFPHHQPDPANAANLQALIEAVRLNNADVGIAFDGDGDRMALVDSAGKIILPDRQMMVFAKDLLASKPGAEIIFDAACSKHLPEQIKKRGGHSVLWNSGRSQMQSRLRETGAAMAADMTGHFLFNDRWFGFADALYAAVRMIGILSADTRTSSELFDELPDSPCTPEIHVAMAEGESSGFIKQLIGLAQFNNVYMIKPDGMRVEFSDGWGLIRAANNGSGIVLRFEGDNLEAMQRIQSEFKTLMLKIKPDLSLPF